MDSSKQKTITFNSSLWILMPVTTGMLLTIYIFYPGYMSPDSIDQLTQARQGLFTDWHPPMMSWLWGCFDRIIPGPLGMLVFHNLLFWSGVGLLVPLIVPHWSNALKCIVIITVGMFPPIFMLLSTIWKDVGMAGAFLFGSAWIFYAEKKQSLIAFVLGIIAIGYGMALRHNAIIATIPLGMYASKTLYNLLSMDFKRHQSVAIGVMGFVLLGLMLGSIKTIEKRLTHGSTIYPIQQIFVHDLTALSIDLDTVLLPDYLLQPQLPTIEDLKKIYTPDTIVPLFCCDRTTFRLQMTQLPKDISDLFNQWGKTILAHPLLYLTHRMRVFSRQFGIVGKRVCYPYHYGIDNNSLGLLYKERPLTRVVFAAIKPVDNFLFRGWIYIVISTAMLTYISLRKKRDYPLVVTAINFSGWFYGMAYFFIATTCDFRMHYWTVVATVVSVVSSISIIKKSNVRRKSSDLTLTHSISSYLT
ncbi:MAG: hypothetical protein V1850_05770 [Candidatus Bathyarchaeota archaeon]